jgi:hypothetical protein
VNAVVERAGVAAATELRDLTHRGATSVGEA